MIERCSAGSTRSGFDLKPKGGSPAWIRTTIHGSKGRCPTIRRPGKMLAGLLSKCTNTIIG